MNIRPAARVPSTGALLALYAAALVGSAPAQSPRFAVAASGTGCLPEGNGYLRARIRGARNLDLDWHDAELECEGGARTSSPGISLTFAGPLRPQGHRLRLVFGVRSAGEGTPGSALPTNLTVIFEGERQLYATQGDDKCTVDSLRQERVAEVAAGKSSRAYRVVARGFCTAPASTLSGKERIVVESFDFAGRVSYGHGAASGSGAPK